MKRFSTSLVVLRVTYGCRAKKNCSSQYLIVWSYFQNSVNARYQTIPYPWLVFGEKVKVNTVFIRDSTGVSDSILILFGGSLNHGVQVIIQSYYVTLS